MLRLRTLICVLAGLLATAAPASAHRVHAGVTEIAVNPRTGEMEVITRVFAHDLAESLFFPRQHRQKVLFFHP